VMTGVGSVRNVARVAPGDTVAVVGCGGVGLNVIQGARLAGARTIIAIDRVHERLCRARDFGATHTVHAGGNDEDTLVAQVLALADHRGVDHAFEATGVAALAFLPLRLVRNGGNAVQVSGAHGEGTVALPRFFWNKRYLAPLYGDCVPARDFPWLFERVARGELELSGLVSHRYPLERLDRAFADMLEGRSSKGVLHLAADAATRAESTPVRASQPAREETPVFRTIERSDPAIAADGLEFLTAKSRALGRRADVALFVPPQARGVTDLPIAMLLHGVYGSHWAWALKGDAHRTLARLVDAGALPPVALLMPSDGLWGDGSGYVPHARQDAERWIVEEVPALARATVPGCTVRSPLLVAGLSMGGFGALRLAGKHPQRFAAAAAHSAVTDAAALDTLIEESRANWSATPADRSVLAALTGAATPLPPLRFDCGRDDPWLDANRALHAALREAGIAHVYAERDGGHDWAYWRAALEDTLRFFGTVLRGEGIPASPPRTAEVAA
ncbi:MAG: zinc-binding dehydrogenase, partial [Lysobacter sp.]|nr:zinc-binding dehydrogenase [Lysobacter sp.]